MSATAKVSASLVLLPSGDAATQNNDTLTLTASLEIAAESNTVAQIRIDADDYTGPGDPAKIILPLSPPGGTITVNDGTDVFTTSAAHNLAVGDEILFTTTTTLPAPLVAGVSYWVHSVPTGSTLKIATLPGAAALDITTTGTGTHSWQSRHAIVPTFVYPAEGPVVPPIVRDKRDGRNGDFTYIKALQVILIPTDSTADSSGQIYVTAGGIGDDMNYFHVPLAIDGAADTNPIATAIIAIPPGMAYNDDDPLYVRIEASENLTVIINLLGN